MQLTRGPLQLTDVPGILDELSSTHGNSGIKSSKVYVRQYYPHLDGLRALAILSIMIEHFGLQLPTFFRYGPLGVRFFFVLSGYFITLSLWKLQARITAHPEKGGTSLFQFYLGRFLRIGPPFYLALLVGLMFGIEDVRKYIFWLATFQTNHLIAHLGYWPDSISHFWSLAVQEQFYLLWPAIVLGLPRRWFVPCMALFILFGLGFRIFCIMTETSNFVRWMILCGCIDSFAAGALIASLQRSQKLEKIWSSHRLSLIMPVGAFVCFFLGRALMTLPSSKLWGAVTESVDAVFLAWLLALSIHGLKGQWGKVLSWGPLVYLGKISYGIYVYHVFVLIIFSPLLVYFGLSDQQFSMERLIILFLLTLLLASLSWHFFERPFMAWKNAVLTHRVNHKIPGAALSAP